VNSGGIRWQAAMKEFLPWVSQFGKTLYFVAHNNKFDQGIFLKECQHFKILLPSSLRFGCSLQYARYVLSESKDSKSLESLCKQFNIANTKFHRADSDVAATVEVLSLDSFF